MIWIQKDLSDLLTDGGAPRLARDFAGDAFTDQVSFQTPNLSGFPLPSTPSKVINKDKTDPPPTVE